MTGLLGHIWTKGGVNGTFNKHFQKLTQKDQRANLDIAKSLPFSDTNVQLREYVFGEADRKASAKESLWELEEVYQFLICAVCPVNGDYEPGGRSAVFCSQHLRTGAATYIGLIFMRQTGGQIRQRT